MKVRKKRKKEKGQDTAPKGPPHPAPSDLLLPARPHLLRFPEPPNITLLIGDLDLKL
jgi:hypothetical protein